MDLPTINPSSQNTNSQPVISPDAINVSSKTNIVLKTVLFIFLFVVLVGGGILFGKYHYSPKTVSQKNTAVSTVIPSNDLTTDWILYTSDNGDYQIKYPNDWQINNLLGDNLAWTKTTSEYIGFAPKTVGEDVMGSIRKTSDKLDKVVSETKTQMTPSGSPSKLISEEKTVFNGYPVTKIVFNNSLANVSSVFYFIDRNNQTYVINYSGTQDVTIIDKIFSTFKFTQ